ncbi:tRNA (N6-threonylcarbamoyladenosine(37)-N6)-methyltransferase TrmO [Candidatus Poribacteria bacterium]|nr:tRNA (N6-threonylcarbamoyladenosine(37)-N6)-methyltransferase TrmO [Candidatus Poribacteria bacterium]
MEMVLRPVGIVIKKQDDISEIEIYQEYSPGLKSVENRTHLWIMFWMSRLSEADRKVLQAHPMGDRSKEIRGVFALRSPMRPNPIGLTKIELISKNENILIVSGLDAFEGSPIIDIKPA